jgi:hypothetical protein
MSSRTSVADAGATKTRAGAVRAGPFDRHVEQRSQWQLPRATAEATLGVPAASPR